jgi:hypothetical protein
MEETARLGAPRLNRERDRLLSLTPPGQGDVPALL